ncbi:MAG: hypothetical protein NUW07_02785 [Candidatus Saccharicenans sp.]|jgi:hypothetical protein|nr:hypothetical protein [Candidatus Saccharicenans sp.]MDH7493627.1 hypothetical protein [Candidatus Saccharicenans sp.]
MNHNLLVNLAGWLGALMLLLAYTLVSSRKLAGDSLTYQLLNLAGSSCLLWNAFHFGAYPSVGVNSIWIVIALFTIFKSQSRNQKEG